MFYMGGVFKNNITGYHYRETFEELLQLFRMTIVLQLYILY